MSRTAVYSAIVLRSRPSGESNSEVSLLTAEEGIVRATVFGGPKSKLRAYAAPYNSGQVWVYRGAGDYIKLSDFDVHSWRAGLRELYERTMAAGAVAETILCTHGGGGDWGNALELAAATLDALENAGEELCERLLVHFLWRWAGFLGLQPNIEACASCGDRADASPIWYSAREDAVFCVGCVREGYLGTELCPQDQALSPNMSSVPKTKLCPQDQALSPRPSSVPKHGLCPQNRALSPKTKLSSQDPALSPRPSSVPKHELCPQDPALSPRPSSVPKHELCPQNRALSPNMSSVPGLLEINSGCRRWLSAVGSIEPALLHRYSMDNKSFYDAKSLTAAVLTGALGKRLASWDF